MNNTFLEELFNKLNSKVNDNSSVSYTAKLLDEPELLAKKLVKKHQS